MVACEVLADSVGPNGKRLTTVVVSGFWKLLQAELNTHRWFSRNSASSRAIPSEKLRQRIINEPAMPVFWGKNQAGMQAQEELSPSKQKAAKDIWIDARNKMLMYADQLAEIGLHKQLCNRLLEPWMATSIIISSTEWDGFDRQRCHPDAQPEFRVAAEAIRTARLNSVPTALNETQWHLPLVRMEDWDMHPELHLIKLSVARCARVSYLTHDGKRDPSADFELYDRLTRSGHWSPFEHVASPFLTKDRCGNFIGWHQHRADVDPHFIR